MSGGEGASIRVLIADDHTLFRRGLRRILDEQPGLVVVGEATSGRQAAEAARTLEPDVVLMDVKMPDGDGVWATAAVRAASHAQVIMLTISEADADLFGAIKAGARGYLLKNADEEQLIEAIRRVHLGEAMLSPSIAARVLRELADSGGTATGHQTGQSGAPSPNTPSEATPPHAAVVGAGAEQASEASARLTEREREILSLLAQGLSNRDIARHLHLSPHTVKTHIRHILDKLHARNRAQAVARGITPSG